MCFGEKDAIVIAEICMMKGFALANESTMCFMCILASKPFFIIFPTSHKMPWHAIYKKSMPAKPGKPQTFCGSIATERIDM